MVAPVSLLSLVLRLMSTKDKLLRGALSIVEQKKTTAKCCSLTLILYVCLEESILKLEQKWKVNSPVHTQILFAPVGERSIDDGW